MSARPRTGTAPGRGARQRLPRRDGQRQVLQRVGAPEREHHVLAARDVGARAEGLEVDARRDQLGVEPQLAQALAVPRGDRHVAELRPVGVEHGVAGMLVVGVVGGLDVLHEVNGQSAHDARAPHRRRGHPPRRDLDRIELRERGGELVVAGKAVHGHAQREPVGRIVERVQRHLVAARGQAVEVLEDVAVSAADARPLGRVGDPQAPIARTRRAGGRAVSGRGVSPRRGCGDRARVEEPRPTLPEQPL